MPKVAPQCSAGGCFDYLNIVAAHLRLLLSFPKYVPRAQGCATIHRCLFLNIWGTEVAPPAFGSSLKNRRRFSQAHEKIVFHASIFRPGAHPGARRDRYALWAAAAPAPPTGRTVRNFRPCCLPPPSSPSSPSCHAAPLAPCAPQPRPEAPLPSPLLTNSTATAHHGHETVISTLQNRMLHPS